MRRQSGFSMAVTAALAGCWLAAALPAADIDLQPLPDTQTQLTALLDAWKSAELTRQGGAFVSHGWWPWGLRAFDLDNDGDLDLIASHHGVPGSSIFKNQHRETGIVKFTDITAALGVDSRLLPTADDRPWIWDFDGDGFLDLGSFSDEASKAIVYNRGGTALEIGPTSFTSGGLSHPKEILDINKDGYPDVDGGSKGYFLYAPATRSFTRVNTNLHPMPAGIPTNLQTLEADLKAANPTANRFLSVGYYTHFINGNDTLGLDPKPIDINGDGRGDVIVAGYGAYGGVYLGRYLLGQSDGTFLDKTADLGMPEDGCPIYYGDLTGDGRPDLVLAGSVTGGFYQNTATGFVFKTTPMSAFLKNIGPYLLRAFRVDFDNDGDFDLVLSNPRLGGASVFANTGNGTFATVLTLTGRWDSNGIVICDIDNDGRMDLLTGGPGGHSSTQITVYLNKTAAGHYIRFCPRGAAPNYYGVDAVIEVFAAGTMAAPNAKPFFIEKAHWDGTPIHVGLGVATAADLRITFPDGTKIERANLAADRTWTVRHNGTVTSDATGNQPPTIDSAIFATPNPVIAAATSELFVAASDSDGGPSPLVYTWAQISGPAAGATFSPNATTGANLTTATFSASGAYGIRVTVFDGAASVQDTISLNVTLPVAAVPPSITTQPSNQTITAGQTATFTVTATGTAPLTYQWKFGSANAGTNSNTLTIVNAQASNAGNYSVTVTNAQGSVTSAVATLTVTPAPVPPTITNQPSNKTVTAGQTATFTVTATGTAPLTYQWKFGSANVGTNSNTLTIVNAQASNAGNYSVTVTNAQGSVTSAVVSLTVNPASVAPTLIAQPSNQTVTAGQTATFAVTATGTAPLAYLWKKNGLAVGSNTATLVIVNAQAANAGNYTVTVSNAQGSVTSAGATLTVTAAPVLPPVTPPTSTSTSTEIKKGGCTVATAGGIAGWMSVLMAWLLLSGLVSRAHAWRRSRQNRPA